METEEEFELMEEIAEEPQEPVQKEHSKNGRGNFSNQTKRKHNLPLLLLMLERSALASHERFSSSRQTLLLLAKSQA